MLLGPEELDSCRGSVDCFSELLEEALAPV